MLQLELFTNGIRYPLVTRMAGVRFRELPFYLTIVQKLIIFASRRGEYFERFFRLSKISFQSEFFLIPLIFGGQLERAMRPRPRAALRSNVGVWVSRGRRGERAG